MARVMPRSWHQAVASLAIVLFAVQNYVTQTHIHLLAKGAAAVQAESGTAQFHKAHAPEKKLPADDPANCPICQDIALAGHFTTPAVIPVLPPALIGVASAPVLALAIVAAQPSHNWQGRAPPRN